MEMILKLIALEGV